MMLLQLTKQMPCQVAGQGENAGLAGFCSFSVFDHMHLMEASCAVSVRWCWVRPKDENAQIDEGEALGEAHF